jgi:glycosyltransferase involved in cell wall biosynthesis
VRIAILSPVWFAVPPSGYGGIEWVVSLLAEAPSAQIGRSLPELHHALECFGRAGDFDVINDHAGPASIPLGGLVDTPVVHTVHGPLGGEPGAVYERLGTLAPDVGLISISLNQRRPKPNLNWVGNCANALDLQLYPCKPHRGEYLLFLGRMSADKGAHRAIGVAMESGLPLKLAGKKQDEKEIRYFEEFVEPHLVDGIEYLGEVSHGQKVELLQIDDGRSGIIVDDYRQMPAALERADALDPLECRRYVEDRYGPQRMVADYLDVFERAIAAQSASSGAA